MKKRLTLLTAIVLCFAVILSFSACSTTDDDETDEFVAATLPVSSNVPVSESEIIDFYNDILTNLQSEGMFDETNKPGVSMSESLSVNNLNVLSYDDASGEAVEDDSLKTLNKSAKAIKSRVLSGVEKESAVIAFGDTATSFSTVIYPYNGISSLTVDDVVNAECNVDGSNLNITITLEGNVDTVNTVFGTRDKTQVLAEFNENTADYATVNDYTVDYVADEENNTYSVITLAVEVEEQEDGTYACTGRIMSLDIKIICDVAANMTCVGSFADYGDIQVQFRLTDEKYYEFDWLGTSDWEPYEEVTE